MKILITGTTGESMPPPYGGIPKVSLLYAREWKRMGHEVAVTFTYRPETADDLSAGATYFFEYTRQPTKRAKASFLLHNALLHPLRYLGFLLAYVQINSRVTIETILYAAYGVWLDRIIASWQPDIVLGEAALIKSFMAARSANRHRIPIVLDTYAEVRDLGMGVNKHFKPKARRRYWERLLAMTEFVMGMSNCSDGPLMYMPREKVKVFYDTCDFTNSRAALAESVSDARAALSLPQDMRLVGAVGAFSPRKGHDHLIRAVGELGLAGEKYGVVLCGAGDATEWKALAEKEGIADRVFFLQSLSECNLARLYRSVDLYANLSNSPRSCGLDLALLEAMTAQKPVVVYDTGALPTAVPDGKNGYVVHTDDVPGVVMAIRAFFALPEEERTQMGVLSAEAASKCDIVETAKIKINWLQEAITNFKK